ncbi:protein MIX23-like [Mya arenaria]|uniref:protein MIX23-like n=1 Tax=Mya arenaria TaxID=6604 RepID=UPI0022E6D2D5|nr:protein MIX23-like [Mya arenaria]
MAAPMVDGTKDFCPCDDIIRFTKTLNKLRQSDDRFIYKLNSMLPTQTFKTRVNPKEECAHLYEHMLADYNHREKSIQRCIDLKKSEIHELRQKQAENRDDTIVREKLHTATYMIKQFQKEVPQEMILRQKSFQLFYERCGDHYQPSSS